MVLQLAHDPYRAVSLAGAILLDLLIWIVAMELDNAMRAIDLGHEVVDLCGVAPQEIDFLIG